MKNYRKTYKEMSKEDFPDSMSIIFGNQRINYRKKKWGFKGELRGLRYGDNPEQSAAMYELVEGNLSLAGVQYLGSGDGLISSLGSESLTEGEKHLGKSNLTDVDAALNILKYFEEPSAVIMKHNNPSGVASRDSIKDAYVAANFADRIAAFGGVLVVNRPVCRETAEEINKNYIEVVAAPDFEKDAFEILRSKKNVRLMKISRLRDLRFYRSRKYFDFKSLMDGGLIVQESPDNDLSPDELVNARADHKGKVFEVERKASEKEIEDMLFAYKVLQGVISNSMVFAKDKTTLAICAGEQDRVGATELAIMKCYKKFADRACFEMYGKALWEIKKDSEKSEEIDRITREANAGLKGSVLASDGFLPFRDTVDAASKENIAGIVQPGGSVRDWESIQACNEHGIGMVFTGKRVFRH